MLELIQPSTYDYLIKNYGIIGRFLNAALTVGFLVFLFKYALIWLLQFGSSLLATTHELFSSLLTFIFQTFKNVFSSLIYILSFNITEKDIFRLYLYGKKNGFTDVDLHSLELDLLNISNNNPSNFKFKQLYSKYNISKKTVKNRLRDTYKYKMEPSSIFNINCLKSNNTNKNKISLVK